ncbi:hypothetical protein D3C80_1385790 [compost metagenome]
MPAWQAASNCTSSLTTLVNCDCCIVEEFDPSNNTTGSTCATVDLCTSTTNQREVNTNATTILGNTCGVVDVAVDRIEVVADLDDEAARDVTVRTQVGQPWSCQRNLTQRQRFVSFCYEIHTLAVVFFDRCDDHCVDHMHLLNALAFQQVFFLCGQYGTIRVISIALTVDHLTQFCLVGRRVSIEDGWVSVTTFELLCRQVPSERNIVCTCFGPHREGLEAPCCDSPFWFFWRTHCTSMVCEVVTY